MNVAAFIVAVVAAVAFLAETARTRSLIAAGLTLVTVAWIVELTWRTVHLVHF